MANTTNSWINYISASLVRTQSHGERTFKSVSVPVLKDISEDGFMSIAVNDGQVYQSKTKDGQVSDRFVNILVGKPEASKKVSVKKNGAYETISMTSADIVAAYAASRAAYRAAQQPAVAVETEPTAE